MENNVEAVKKESRKIFTSLIIVIVVILGGFFLLRGSTPPVENPDTNTQHSDIGIMPITEKDHILGNPNAKVFIVEYSDTGCPFCKRFHGDMHNLIKNNQEVAWVYRHYPILSLHPEAFKEAVASECAALQGGNEIFWNYIDEIYAAAGTNSNISTEKKLINIAEKLNLNSLKFKTCLDTMETAPIVEAHMADASLNGVRGTPTSFVLKEGKLVQTIPGALPYSQLVAFLKDLLK